MNRILHWQRARRDGSASSPSTSSTTEVKRPLLLSLRSSKTFIIITVATAVFTDIFAYGIVVPVLPFALTTRAGVDPSQVQKWVSILLAIYGAALLVTAPFCGWAADRYSSRRVPLLLGLVALGGSTAMLCAGSSLGVLAAGRVLQGMSAAVVWVVGLALLVDTVGPEEVGVAMGYVGLSMSLALLIAPLLGGVVFAQSGYYAVFAMAFGLIALDVVLRLIMIEKKVVARLGLDSGYGNNGSAINKNGDVREDGQHNGDGQKFPDDRSQELSAQVPDVDMEMQPQASSNRRAQDGHGPPATSTTASTGQLTSRRPQRFMPSFVKDPPPLVTLLASRRILAALWGCTMQATLLTSFDSLLPLFVKGTFSWNAIGAGLIFLPVVVTSFLGPLFGYLSDKYGPRWLATTGFLAGCPFLILLRLVTHNTLEQKVLLCALLALIGATLTLVLTPMMAEITYAVDAKARRRPPGFFGRNGAYAQAYSLFNMAWAAGSMIGPLLGGLVNSSSGWPAATLILGVISAVTAIPTAIWTGGSIFGKMKAKRTEEQQEVQDDE